MFSVNSDFRGGFQLHADIDVGIFAAADLHDGKAGPKSGQLLRQALNILLQGFANFPVMMQSKKSVNDDFGK